MPANSYNTRTELAGVLPEPIYNQIFDGLKHESLVARSFKTVPMSAGTQRIAVTDLLPIGYFIGETEMGQASETAWANKSIIAETLVCFVPIAKSVLEDAAFDIWGAILPNIKQSLARTLDAAVLFGQGKPSSWPSDLSTLSTAASNALTANTTAANGGLSEDFNRADERLRLAGFAGTHILGGDSLKNLIRRNRNSQGDRLVNDFAMGPDGTYWMDMPVLYGTNGLFTAGSGNVFAFVVDGSQNVLGIRRDINVEVLNQAVITSNDGTGKVLYNAATQDGVVLKVTMRCGFQVANAVSFASQFGGTNEVVTLTQASSGAGNMTVTFGGYTTANAMDAEISAANMQLELEKLPSIGAGNITVARSGSAGARVFTLTFKNALGSTDVSAVTATIVTGTITPAVSTAGAAAARASVATLKTA